MSDPDFLLADSAHPKQTKPTTIGSSETDPRIKNLSYSSLLTLHSCPRKFQLYKLGAEADPEAKGEHESSITFSYGHVIGEGIQNILEGKTREQYLWAAFLKWNVDLFTENEKQNKSFFGAVLALDQFAAMRDEGFLSGYELAYYEGKPACELSFAIILPDGFIYRGFVDAVLVHKETGEVLVLECKTTSSFAVNPATYKNSAQAIGYSIVLDAIFPNLSSYKVQYLVYQSKSSSYKSFEFNKSFYQRALWIQELLLDIEVIKLYESSNIYPMHGESCYAFMRECEYYGVCTLSTERLSVPIDDSYPQKAAEELEKFQIKISLQDLIAAQMQKESKPVSSETEMEFSLDDEVL